MPDVEDAEFLFDADNEAAANQERGVDWQSVHEAWARRTGCNLSPSSFGKRIQVVQRRPRSGRSRSPMSQLPPTSQSSAPQPPYRHTPEYRPPVHGPSYQRHSACSTPLQRQPSDSLQTQRVDINRIDGAVSRLQLDVRTLQASMDNLRLEIRRSHGISGPSNDASALDVLSDTVTRQAAKVGEVDGLKVQIDQLRRHLRRMEDGSAGSMTPSQPEPPLNRPPPAARPTMPPLPPPTSAAPPPALPHARNPPQSLHPPAGPHAPLESDPRGWNAANSMKRKSSGELDEADPANKRARPSQSGPYIENLTRSGPEHPPHLAPIRSFSNEPPKEAWQHPPNLPAIRGAPYQRGKPGRPSKHPEGAGTPPWERDAWRGGDMELDGYCRPLGGVPTSPTMLERGRLVRRGSGGGLQYMDHAAVAKKTRQKPIRNSEGVLIRKDGKPDQRSISSPMNLKKVHARKLAEAESAGVPGGSASNPTSPSLVSPDGVSDESAKQEEYEEVYEEEAMSAGSNEKTDPGHPRKGSRNHSTIMRQMFPHGVEDDAGRMNHASQLLDHETDAGSKIQPTGHLVTEEIEQVSESAESSRRTSDKTAEPLSAASSKTTNTWGAENHQPPKWDFNIGSDRQRERTSSQTRHVHDEPTVSQTTFTVKDTQLSAQPTRRENEESAQRDVPVSDGSRSPEAARHVQISGALSRSQQTEDTNIPSRSEPGISAAQTTQDTPSTDPSRDSDVINESQASHPDQAPGSELQPSDNVDASSKDDLSTGVRTRSAAKGPRVA